MGYNEDRQQYEDWHKFGRDRGWFDRATDEVKSWFGDEEAERRRRMDSQMYGEHRGHRPGYDEHRSGDQPDWQRRDYAGSSPRGAEIEPHGRYDMQYDQERHMRHQSMSGRGPSYGIGRERQFENEQRGTNQQRYGSSEPRWGNNEHRWGSSEPRWSSNEQRWGSNDMQRSYGQSQWEQHPEQRMGMFGGPRQQEHSTWFGSDRDREHGMRRGGMLGGFFDNRDEFGNHRGRGPRGYHRADERIADEVCEFLTLHPELDASDIDVVVNESIVTLRGRVDHRHDKRIAEEIAEDVYGVKEVHNELRIERMAQQQPGMTKQDQVGGRSPLLGK